MSDIEHLDMKKAVEAVLFSVGKKISTKEIAKIVGCQEEAVLEHITGLIEDYHSRDSPIVILSEGRSWKMTIRETYLPVVQALIPEAELTKSVLETLAIIAWKAPLLQSEVVEIRSTKAYEHIHALVDQGFVNKERSGRSYLLKLTQKFLDYFDLKSPEEIQDKFSEYGSVKGLVALFNRNLVPQPEQEDSEETPEESTKEEVGEAEEPEESESDSEEE